MCKKKKWARAWWLLLSLVVSTGFAAEIPVILDTDANNELDDQHAIAYLLLNGDTFDLAGITVNQTWNGGELSQHLEEAERVVSLCGLEGEVPVIAGASKDFETIRPHVSSLEFDGYEAVDFIIRRARTQAEGRLVLLPIGKLTNVALALEKAPDIRSRVRIVWLGSNYPEPGEYNQDNDPEALNYILEQDVPFEIVTVRYGKASGTDFVRIAPEEVNNEFAGKGPFVEPPVADRDGKEFSTFGDYAVGLFSGVELHGEPPSRALFDMAAVAIVKNPGWAESRTLPAPTLSEGKWLDQPANERSIILWENFDRDAIIDDFVNTLSNPIPVTTH